MEPAASIIERFGGPTKVAALLGVHRTRVHNWKATRGGTGGLIPQRYHVRLLEEARRAGIPLTANDFLARPAPQSGEAA